MAELVWEGKYRDNKRVAPVRLALPFQTVETVNESAQDRMRTLDLFASGKPSAWRNRLIWGDKKYVLPSLLPEFAGKINLIYIDPPFDTGADFSFTTEVPDADATLVKQPSIIEQKAYRDTWGHGMDSYLHWFYETAALLRELLAESGSIYVHLDWHVGHYVKPVLDEVFGEENFINTITWKRSDAHSDVGQGAKHLGRICDCIFYYSKTPNAQTLNMQFMPLPASTTERWYRHVEEGTGRRYNKADITGPGGATKGNPVYEWKGITRAWRYSKKRMEELEKQGRVVYSSSGMAYQKRYLDESKGVPLQDLWDDIKMVRGIHANGEAVGYDTQKPEALLDRIIKTSSNPGDLVLDCFCGSGTTAAVAEKTGRRWVAADLGRFAVHTTRKRLLSIPGIKPFTVQNLGKYERQAWMAAEFAKPEDRAATEAAYRKFILDLFHAEPLTGNAWLHGVKGGRMVHVGAVDAPITIADVKAISREVWRSAGGKPNGGGTAAVDILGWEFAFELNETAKQVAAESRVDVKFRRIPREVLEKAAVDQGDIQAKDFFELRALSTKVTKNKRTVSVELTDFMLPAEDLPDDVAKAVKHWSQWIDYWAVDWTFDEATHFHNQWQSFRTRQNSDLELKAESPPYKEPGKYTIVVKVIDILGNDTTKSMDVEVK